MVMDDATPPPSTSGPVEATAEADGTDVGSRSPWRWVRWVLLAVVAAVALFFGAIWVYANWINDPEDALTTEDLAERVGATTVPAAPDTTPATDPGGATTAPPATTAPVPPTEPAAVDGTWIATPDSELGYRVDEILFGTRTQGVGRTNEVTGTLTIEGTDVTAVDVEVDMASVTSDDSRRDGQFRGRIMTVAEYPTATFVLTEPIELGRIPDEGAQVTATATGDLTLRGVTNAVTFDVTAQLQGQRIGVLGAIPVVFADYLIANPSISGITTEDEGLLEFVLVFERTG